MLLTLILFMLMVAEGFTHVVSTEHTALCMRVHASIHVCTRVSSYCCDLHSTVNHPPSSPHPWLHPPPLSSPPRLPEVMSLRADGAQIKLTPAFLLLSIGELKLVYFYDLFISLLSPPACMRGRRGALPVARGQIHRSSSRTPASVAKSLPSPLKSNLLLWLLNKTIIKSQRT